MARSMNELLTGLRAAAERTRLRLLAILADGELTVSEITRIVNQSQPRVSRHLKVLCDAGLLIRFREQHHVLYRVPAKGSGADLALRLLELVPLDDETLQLDRTRMEEVKAERARAAASFLRFNAEDWARLRAANVDQARVNRAILDALSGAAVGDLLDIGTGMGLMLELLGKHAESAVGVDISPDMLRVARSAVHAAGLDKVMLRHADMYRLPFPDATFDTVTLDQVLSQAADPALAIAEAVRILRPGGRVLVVDFSLTPDARQRLAAEGGEAGVSEQRLDSWLRRAGLNSTGIHEIPGEMLTVLLTVATRLRDQTAAA